MALLLGSDYDSQGLQGIGPENALKFLQSIPNHVDPLDHLRALFSHMNPQNKYEQKICNIFKDHPDNLTHFEKIIKEYSSSELESLPRVISIASIKWLKPVRVKQLQVYMKKKLGWIESYTFTKVKNQFFQWFFSIETFVFQVFPLLTRFQILYRLNMLELDVNDVLSLSDTTIFQPIVIKKIRLRQGKQYYEVEWKQHDLPSTPTLEQQMNNLSLMVVDENDDDDDQEQLITIEPAELFRCAYPEIVHTFETPIAKVKKPKKVTSDVHPIMKKKKAKQLLTTAAMSTSMSLDLLSMMHDETCEIPIIQKRMAKFNHRPTMAALSTSINIDLLNILHKSNDNLHALKKTKSRPIKHHTRSDMIIHSMYRSFHIIRLLSIRSF